MPKANYNAKCSVVVLWIDWYAYHLARFEGLQEAFGRQGEVVGLEMVGGIGVHAGINFREDRPPDLPIETLKPDSNWHKASKIGLAFLVWKRLTALKPQIVLVPGYYTLPALAAAIWARLHGRGSVLMTESTASDHPRASWKEALKSLVISLLFNWAVTGGKAHVRYLTQLKFPATRIASSYNVVGTEFIGAQVAAIRRASDASALLLPTNYFLFVGRLAPEKNVKGLLHAWETYRDAGGSWGLVIAGGGPDSAELREIATQAPQASDIVFTGHKTSTELLPFFAFARCFILPSTREPWGLVVNEAMAASLPVVVSSICGCAEDLVVNASNGFVFDPSVESELPKCLQAIESLSKKELDEFGRSSAERISHFSPHRFGMEIASISRAIRDKTSALSASRESAA